METEFPRNNGAAPTKPAPRSLGRTIVIGLAVLVGLAGIGLAAAQSSGQGGGMGGHMMMHGSMGGKGFAERRLGYILDAVKATPEQSEKIRAIVSKAHEDMHSTREGFMDARDKMADILGAPTIDRAAAENIRAERVQVVDQASKTLTTALLDAAEVLTPEQRADLVQKFKERRAFGRW